MATDLSGGSANIKVQIAVTAEKELDASTPRDKLAVTLTEAFTFGNGAGKFDQVYHDTNTIDADGTEGIDLAGDLSNAFGGSIGFDAIKALLVRNRSDELNPNGVAHAITASQISFSTPAANGCVTWCGAAEQSIVLPAGASVLLIFPGAGYVVSADDGDLLELNEDSTAEACYEIVIIGENS